MSQNENKNPKYNNFERLEEMITSMQESIDNAKNVLTEQQLLIEVLKPHDDKFKKLQDSLQESCKDLEIQIATLSFRKNALKSVFEFCTGKTETSIVCKDVVNSLLDALGVFNR